MQIVNAENAFQLLDELNAPKRLIHHAELVLECAEIILSLLDDVGVNLDAELVRIGAIIHDIGKIIYPVELNRSGKQHCLAGKRLLLEKGVSEQIAEICVSHDDIWTDTDSLETLVVILADKLWKGKRNQDLENQFVRSVAKLLNRDYWSVYIMIDKKFEDIANQSHDRLLRS